MRAIAPWVLRAGAILGIASLFLPHVAVGARTYGPAGAVKALSPLMPPLDFAAHAAWLAAPAAAAFVVLAGSTPAGRRNAFSRGAAVALCLAASFALATLGSIVMTGVERTGTLLTVAGYFVVPLLAAGIVVSRLLGSAAPEPTAAVARLSIGVFLILNGFFLADWWSLFAVWTGNAGTERALAGVWAGPAGGLLVAGGEAIGMAAPAPVDTPLPAG